ncbi:MAG TPA: hypothetical protein PKY60_11015 [Thermoflexales bacterium]|nr:hypothetical protein [Thermoflexales bacterium]
MIKVTCDTTDEMVKLVCKVVEEKLAKWEELRKETQHGKLEIDFFPNDVVATLSPSYRTKFSRDARQQAHV